MATMEQAFTWAKEHPVPTVLGIAVVGIVLWWMMGGGKGGGSSDGASAAGAYYAASAAQAQAGDQLQAVQIAANAQTAQAQAAAAASVSVNQAWATAQTRQTQFNDQAATAQAQIGSTTAIQLGQFKETTDLSAIAANKAISLNDSNNKLAAVKSSNQAANYQSSLSAHLAEFLGQLHLGEVQSNNNAAIQEAHDVLQADVHHDNAINNGNFNLAMLNAHLEEWFAINGHGTQYVQVGPSTKAA